MKKIIIAVIIIALIIILFGFSFLLKDSFLQQGETNTQNQDGTKENNVVSNAETFAAKEITEVTDQDIALFLTTNPDAKKYMEANKDFEIIAKKILTEDDIVSGLEAENFSEVYQGLDLEDSRYLKVDLMNTAGDNGLVAVLDFKESKVIKAYGLILLKTGSLQ